jgi:hypothetical protein
MGEWEWRGLQAQGPRRRADGKSPRWGKKLKKTKKDSLSQNLLGQGLSPCARSLAPVALRPSIFVLPFSFFFFFLPLFPTPHSLRQGGSVGGWGLCRGNFGFPRAPSTRAFRRPGPGGMVDRWGGRSRFALLSACRPGGGAAGAGRRVGKATGTRRRAQGGWKRLLTGRRA